MNSRRRITIALVGLVALVLVGWLVREASGDMRSVPLSGLPSQAKQTWALIERGGPFPYPHNDGVVYNNREAQLPDQRRGYYHEYTVPTPGSHDRGARRLITGDGKAELYYTDDHYASFAKVNTSGD